MQGSGQRTHIKERSPTQRSVSDLPRVCSPLKILSYLNLVTYEFCRQNPIMWTHYSGRKLASKEKLHSRFDRRIDG